MHIPALRVPSGLPIVTVISDADDLDAVLPLAIVRSVAIYERAQPPSQGQPASAAAIVAAALAPGGAARGKLQVPAIAPTGLAAVSAGSSGAQRQAGRAANAPAVAAGSGNGGAAGLAPYPVGQADAVPQGTVAASSLVSVPAASVNTYGR